MWSTRCVTVQPPGIMKTPADHTGVHLRLHQGLWLRACWSCLTSWTDIKVWPGLVVKVIMATNRIDFLDSCLPQVWQD